MHDPFLFKSPKHWKEIVALIPGSIETSHRSPSFTSGICWSQWAVKGNFRSYTTKMTEPGSLGGRGAEVNLTFAPLASDAYIGVLCEHETFLFIYFFLL